MTDQLDMSAFVVNQREGEFYARFTVTGEIIVPIKADSLDEAKQTARAMAEDEDFGTELDEAHNVDLGYVYKAAPMYLVTRDGRPMQVSHLKTGDLPRQPDERGF